MSWDKIKLENLLSFYAALQGRPLQQRKGVLYSEKAVGVFAALLQMYNQFFVAENRRFLQQDIAVTKKAEQLAYQLFSAERRKYPLLPGFYLPAAAKDKTS